MTQKQFDTIHLALAKLEERVTKLEKTAKEQLEMTKALNDKTLVISDVNREIEVLKVDVDSIKDEIMEG